MFFLVQEGAGFSSQKETTAEQNLLKQNKRLVSEQSFYTKFRRALKAGKLLVYLHWKRSSLADFRMRYYIQLGMQSFSCLYMILADTHRQS